MFLYPTATKYLAQYESKKVIREFETQSEENREYENHEYENHEEKVLDEVEIKETSNHKILELLQELQAYNERLYEEGQSSLQDPFDYETSSIDLTKYGFSQNVIGTLWIPRMEVELPIYLGASHENMALGAGLLGETSVPIGGKNTNVVIAAHRGWKGIPMFRDIQALQLGDKIQITTPWDTLIYRVCELKVILPGDSDEILIQEGRDLVTLLTCHPYTKNYQRYMVVAERSIEETSTKEEDLQEASETYDEEPRAVEMMQEDGTTEMIKVDPASIRPSIHEGEEDGAQFSNLQIWMEDYGVWIGFGIIVFVMFLLFLISRKRKRK